MKNTISYRILDFLKIYPPFFLLPIDDVHKIANEIEVKYFEKNEVIFRKNNPIHSHFYIVKDGAIGIFKENNRLVDECDDGDIFGLRAFIQNDNYALDAIATEESILYAIPLKLFKELITNNKSAQNYIETCFSANFRTNKKLNIYSNSTKSINNFNETQTASFTKKPKYCSRETSIKEAAILMKNHNIGSLLIVNKTYPIGIITDKDLRNKIATGIHKVDEKIENIMSSPVICYSEKISVAEAQIAMLKHSISHLCLTKDGTAQSDVIGIISEHDVLVSNSNNPAVLIKQIKRSKDANELKEIRKKAQILLNNYLNKNIPVTFVSNVISEINNVITQKIIQLSISKINKKPPVSFSWLTIGSQGRNEQLLLTDQDNALVYKNSENNKFNKEYFLELALLINNQLEVVGFEKCPANMMASNPKWCLSVSEWQTQFNSWITEPTEEKMLLSNIFFDFSLVYGDESLIQKMSKSIFSAIEKHDIFLNFLAKNAIQNPPPLSFFRNFLVEESGSHKNEFDIKKRAIMPLVDAARVLLLSHKIEEINNTTLRFKKLATLEPQNKYIYDACVDAFEELLNFRTKQGLSNNNSGRFIKIESLTKFDRLKLKKCFKPIKEVQELINTRFRLSQIL